MEPKPRIAIFSPWIKSRGGAERVILEILKRSRCDIDLYTFLYDKDRTFLEFKDFDVHVIPSHLPRKSFFLKGLVLGARLLLSKIPGIGDYDVLIISSGGVAELASLRNRAKKTVVLSHTPLRAAHSMYEYYKKSRLANRILVPLAVEVYKSLEKMAWKRLDYAMVLSKEVEQRLVSYGLIKQENILRLGPVVEKPNVKTYKKREKIIFYPSRFATYKRQELAIISFKRAGLARKGFRLVLAGFVEDLSYLQELQDLSEGDKSIVIKTNVSEHELWDLYARSYVTLFLPVNEDTGLVPLESLSCGTPVIAADEGGPREFIRSGVNGLLVKADPVDVASALIKVTKGDVYTRLRKGAARSKRYDEKRFIKKFDSSIKKIVSAPLKA